MPAHLITAETTSSDPRLQKGAYIADEFHLYRVLDTLEEPTQLALGCRKGAPIVTLLAENCKTGWPVKLDLALVRSGCRLVQAAPAYEA
jgi:hypothetical protein